MQLYWQAKIWGLLHDPVFKPLLTDKSGSGAWKKLAVMQELQNNQKLLDYLGNADTIAAASDRMTISKDDSIQVNYGQGHPGLEISHLLSGAKQQWQIADRNDLIDKEAELFPQFICEETDAKKVFWWLWRCLPTAACKASNDENKTSLLLMPADTRIPDTSLWSHTSMTAALAGAAIGYETTLEEFNAIPQEKLYYHYHSHPHLVTFSFAPVQDLIKSSRKMRDFWAGSWILHYLSAKVSWELARLYGPDSLLYPSLFHQPLIDQWLLTEYPEFKEWIKAPAPESLLTAGFPNVIVLVLPAGKVNSAMQTATQYLKKTWRDLGKQVFDELKENRHWTRGLLLEANSWHGWLDAQWQIYWTGLPIGKLNSSFKQKNNEYFNQWVAKQNQTYSLQNPAPESAVADNNRRANIGLFQRAELDVLSKYAPNIGSWWGYIFDATRVSLNSIKNARNWEIPTVFSTRSTISGLGAAVHDRPKDWGKEGNIPTEGEVQKFWKQSAGLFDGRERLNATEVIKRGLHQVLPNLLNPDRKKLENYPDLLKQLKLDKAQLAIAYPDLSAGVAGYLRTSEAKDRDKPHRDKIKAKEYYITACQDILTKYQLNESHRDDYKWGIPWVEKDEANVDLSQYHPRLLNAGWLVEDIPNISTDKELRDARQDLHDTINQFYRKNNPTDWYVLAAGDGDGMSEWLKGVKLKNYAKYVAPAVNERASVEMEKFLQVRKRMGPATHNALSRALLDFSNQLVPYLTETRYAGRLIYGGGDDVLAYTNLWEWDNWLWDLRNCFQGCTDPQGEFQHQGDYWQWKDPHTKPANITARPLFTMGSEATISFGIVIAHQSVPLAIALENLWEAEEKAKEHRSKSRVEILPDEDKSKYEKDAVQVRVIYQNGNIASSTAKFSVFNSWRELLETTQKSSEKVNLDAAIFEQAATVWSQHPAPTQAAIAPWCRAFCSRREAFGNDDLSQEEFQQALKNFIVCLTEQTQPAERDDEIINWLKLAAFTLRRRKIELSNK